MNQDPSKPLDSAKNTDSDHSSASPAPTDYSAIRDDDVSSLETTPPPTGEQAYGSDYFQQDRSKRYSASSSTFSRSYQSMPSSSLPGDDVYHHFSQSRPSTSGTGSTHFSGLSEEDAGLAAAAGLWSLGTPRTGPVHMDPDVPPVPPLPAQYAAQNSNRLSRNMTQKDSQ